MLSSILRLLLGYKEPTLTIFLVFKQFVDDVEFWFPQDKDSIVEYRSASRVGNFDFDVNRRRIKVQSHCDLCVCLLIKIVYSLST